MPDRLRLALRLAAVIAAAVPTLLAGASFGEPFGWFAYTPLSTGFFEGMAQELGLWADLALPPALAVLSLWAPARLRSVGIPLTLLVIAIDVLAPLRYFTVLPVRWASVAALVITLALLLAIRPTPHRAPGASPDHLADGAAQDRPAGDVAPERPAGRSDSGRPLPPAQAAGWTAALLAVLWPLLQLRLSLFAPVGRCGENSTAALIPLPLVVSTLGATVVLLAWAATLSTVAGARLVAAVTAALLLVLALPELPGVTWPMTCLAAAARWPYLAAAVFLALAALGTPKRSAA
ncbi:hypothetical protein [Nonomuraea sp. NPDC048916]|uniref:hypothetical protein n=1 Tax=Nonomuraea sp. NPDC048916 TaxID=3154232 RepID=UPI0034037CF6